MIVTYENIVSYISGRYFLVMRVYGAKVMTTVDYTKEDLMSIFKLTTEEFEMLINTP